MNNNTDMDVPDWVTFLAQDEDGAWWGYEVEPLQHDSGWYENEVGRSVNLSSKNNLSGKHRNKNWQQTLVKLK